MVVLGDKLYRWRRGHKWYGLWSEGAIVERTSKSHIRKIRKCWQTYKWFNCKLVWFFWKGAPKQIRAGSTQSEQYHTNANQLRLLDPTTYTPVHFESTMGINWQSGTGRVVLTFEWVGMIKEMKQV